MAGETATQASGLTALHAVIGTAAYMSPEQADGQPTDYRSDIFSIGEFWNQAGLWPAPVPRRLVAGRPFCGSIRDSRADPPEVTPGVPRESAGGSLSPRPGEGL